MIIIKSPVIIGDLNAFFCNNFHIFYNVAVIMFIVYSVYL